MLHTHLKVVYLCMCIICSVIVIVCYIQNIYDIIISFRRNLTRYAMCAFSGTSVSAMRQFDIGMQNMWSASSCLVVEIKIWIIIVATVANAQFQLDNGYIYQIQRTTLGPINETQGEDCLTDPNQGGRNVSQVQWVPSTSTALVLDGNTTPCWLTVRAWPPPTSDGLHHCNNDSRDKRHRLTLKGNEKSKG